MEIKPLILFIIIFLCELLLFWVIILWKKKKYTLPKNWVIYNDGSTRCREVIDYLNSRGDRRSIFAGYTWWYYGVKDDRSFAFPTKPRNCKLITIDQFLKATNNVAKM